MFFVMFVISWHWVIMCSRGWSLVIVMVVFVVGFDREHPGFDP